MNHQLRLENYRVRVLTTIPRGATAQGQPDRWPSLEYVLSTTNFVHRDADQNVLLDTRAADPLADGPERQDVEDAINQLLGRDPEQHRPPRLSWDPLIDSLLKHGVTVAENDLDDDHQLSRVEAPNHSCV